MSERARGHPAEFPRERRETETYRRGPPPTVAFGAGAGRERTRPRATAWRGDDAETVRRTPLLGPLASGRSDPVPTLLVDGRSFLAPCSSSLSAAAGPTSRSRGHRARNQGPGSYARSPPLWPAEQGQPLDTRPTRGPQSGLDSAFTVSLVGHRLADRPYAAAVLRKGPVVMAAGNWRRITPPVYSGNRAAAHIIASHRLPPFRPLAGAAPE